MALRLSRNQITRGPYVGQMPFVAPARLPAQAMAADDRVQRLDDFAAEYGANGETIARALAVLETEGYVWAVQARGITARYGTMLCGRPRGDCAKRNEQATTGALRDVEFPWAAMSALLGAGR